MSLCRICNNPSMVMDGYYKKKVPFKPKRDAKSIICGRCVAYKDFRDATSHSKCPHFDLCSVNNCPLIACGFLESLPDDPETQCRLSHGDRQRVLNEPPCEVCGRVCGKPVRSDSPSPLKDLKEWRKSKKLTQAKLADILGVNRVQIVKVEKHQRIMPERWKRILAKMYPTHT